MDLSEQQDEKVKLDTLDEEYNDVINSGARFAVNTGWTEIIEDILKKAREDELVINVDQVKEKFGGLRFYWSVPEEKNFDKEIIDGFSDYVHDKESDSFNVCERCGTKDNVDQRGESWVKSLCGDCQKSRELWKKKRGKLRDVQQKIRTIENSRIRKEVEEGEEVKVEYKIKASGDGYEFEYNVDG